MLDSVTEWASDGINLLVAVGTLSLAATAWRSISDTRVAALDTACHRVVVSHFSVDEQPSEHGGNGPNQLYPYTARDPEEHGEEPLAVSATVRLYNEGVGTALVQVQASAPAGYVAVGVQQPVAYDNRYALKPNGEMACACYWWRPTAQWAAETAVARAMLIVTCTPAVGNGPTDITELAFRARPLEFAGDGHWRVVDGESESDELRGTEVSPVRRTYSAKRLWRR